MTQHNRQREWLLARVGAITNAHTHKHSAQPRAENERRFNGRLDRYETLSAGSLLFLLLRGRQISLRIGGVWWGTGNW